jgi:two-component system nitrate/nitrite response regulator NarL
LNAFLYSTGDSRLTLQVADPHSVGEKIRIVIADDHPIFRDGLRMLLEAEQGLAVVGEAGDGEEAVKYARQLEPDILLLDLVMPRSSGLDVLRELAITHSPVRTVVLAAAIEQAQIGMAFQLGARGVVLKESATESLLESIRSVRRGDYWVGRESVPSLVRVLRSLQPPLVTEEGRRYFNLTRRELQVIAAVAGGYTNKDMAQKFSLSEQTIKHHLTHIFDKLGVANRLELVIFSISHSLTDAF